MTSLLEIMDEISVHFRIIAVSFVDILIARVLDFERSTVCVSDLEIFAVRVQDLKGSLNRCTSLDTLTVRV